ncbi:coxsackievirus and adenovirus receptor-like [Channa argus]|uniref:coxsackievirus and adenovirus receptor-like n=1 Tax=Channa argus TaxID=215402 RepID=UPI003522955A
MFALKWMFVCLLTCFLRCSVSQEKAEHVRSGENVILQCRGPRDATMLEWIKPDMKSEEYVFFFREMQSYEDYQHPHFHGRVELVDPKMKDGDYSVILKNVSIDDSGPYECHVGKSNSGRSKRETPSSQLINSVTLNVDSVWRDIRAHSGMDITLPCQTLSTSPFTTVKWTMRNKINYVFLYRDGRSVPDNQHPCYKNWVELKDGEMKDGDASLILKDVRNRNSGIYECWVTQGGTKTSIINLYVYPPGGGAGHMSDGGDKDGRAVLGTSLSFAFFLTVIVGFVVYFHKHFFPHK